MLCTFLCELWNCKIEVQIKMHQHQMIPESWFRYIHENFTISFYIYLYIGISAFVTVTYISYYFRAVSVSCNHFNVLCFEYLLICHWQNCIYVEGFCERLFRQLEGTTERFEVKLMMADLVSRLIGIHQVCLTSIFTRVHAIFFIAKILV